MIFDKSRVYTLEEQLLEKDIESDEKRKEAERRHKEALQRQEREKNIEIDQCMSKIFSLQQELSEERKKSLKQQTVIDKLRDEKQLLEDEVQEKKLELEQMEEEIAKIKEKVRYLKDEDKANKRVIELLHQELLDLRKSCGLPVEMNGNGTNGSVNGTYSSETDGAPLVNGVTNGFRYSKHRSSSKESLLREARIYNEFEDEIKQLRSENQVLRDANEELTAQLLNSHLEEGRSLLKEGAQVSSLAEELRNLSNEEVSFNVWNRIIKEPCSRYYLSLFSGIGRRYSCDQSARSHKLATL